MRKVDGRQGTRMNFTVDSFRSRGTEQQCIATALPSNWQNLITVSTGTPIFANISFRVGFVEPCFAQDYIVSYPILYVWPYANDSLSHLYDNFI